MDPLENHETVAGELIALGRQQGIELGKFCAHGSFLNDRRYISLWRKDELPWSGPVGESVGTLHYAMQGTITLLPKSLKDSASAFRGSWHEAGTLSDLEQAFQFLKAWLLERKEVDDLPNRSVRSYGI